jgi:hypothetical protein
MKNLLLIAAVLSFLSCAGGGGLLLDIALTAPRDALPLVAVGLFLIGMGVFFSAILLAAAERFGRKAEDK